MRRTHASAPKGRPRCTLRRRTSNSNSNANAVSARFTRASQSRGRAIGHGLSQVVSFVRKKVSGEGKRCQEPLFLSSFICRPRSRNVAPILTARIRSHRRQFKQWLRTHFLLQNLTYSLTWARGVHGAGCSKRLSGKAATKEQR